MFPARPTPLDVPRRRPPGLRPVPISRKRLRRLARPVLPLLGVAAYLESVRQLGRDNVARILGYQVLTP